MPPRPQLAPRKRPKQERAKATVDAILTATAHILIDHGLDGLSTNKVAKRAGVSIGSLYQYFPNKDALLRAVFERHTDECYGLLREMAVEVLTEPMPVAVRRCVRALLEAHRHDRELHRVLLGEALGRHVALTVETQRRAIELVRMFLAGKAGQIDRADLETAAFVLVTSVEAVANAMAYPHTDDLDLDAVEHEVVTMVLRYVGATDTGTGADGPR